MQEKPYQIPAHIAIIMDGNGRWAKKNHKPRSFGHKYGAENAKHIAKAAAEFGVKYLTLYAFSTENWDRSPDEVQNLMDLLTHYLKNDRGEIKKNNMRLNVIGEIGRLPKKLSTSIMKLEKETSKNTGLVLTIALSYGGRNEIITAVRKLINANRNKDIPTDEIDEKFFSKYLFTHDMPDPDLFIRPSGEYRVSNFLLWQIAYSELYFTEKYWPEFSKEDLEQAIIEYNNRERRYGR